MRGSVTHQFTSSPRGETLLFENFIACYPNDNVYFRPHEVLAKWVVSEAARLRKLKAID